jgi:hypothetical protein
LTARKGGALDIVTFAHESLERLLLLRARRGGKGKACNKNRDECPHELLLNLCRF